MIFVDLINIGIIIRPTLSKSGAGAHQLSSVELLTAMCRAYAISDYPAISQHAAAIMLMIMNNLDVRVAQFPQELVTYGGNGQVFSNWAQVSNTTITSRHVKSWMIANFIGINNITFTLKNAIS